MPTQINGTTGAGQIAEGTVTTAKVVDGAITPAKTSGFVVTQANQTPLPGAGTAISFTHGLGAAPVSAEFEIVCLTAEYGYAVGDVTTPFSTNASYSVPFGVCKTAIAVSSIVATGGTPWCAINRSTGAVASLTAANWAWRFKVRAA